MAKAYRLSALGIWLKKVLAENQMMQIDLAHTLGVTDVTVSRWVHGERKPRIEQLEKILDIFGYHIEILPNKNE